MSDLNEIHFDNELPSQIVEFDYAEIDRRLTGIDESEDVARLLQGVQLMLKWVCQGQNDKARSIKLQAVRYQLQQKDKTQEALGREIGCQKAAISQQVNELRDYLKEKSGRDVKARGARSQEAREKFSKICKSTHEKRKSTVEHSLKKSTPATTSQFDTLSKLRTLETQPL